MKILVASAFYENHRGGVEIVAGELARQFRRSRQAVTWMASGTDPVPSDDMSGRRVPLAAVFNSTQRFLSFRLPIPGWTALQTIGREVAEADAVMIHDALYPANIATLLFARWFGKPVVLTQHVAAMPYSNPVLRGLMRCMNRLVTRPALETAEQVVFISRLTAEKFKDVAFRRPPHLIFNGVDTDIFRPAYEAEEREAIRKEFGLPVDRPIALFVGHFVAEKGLHILQEAARAADDITWVLAGGGAIDPNDWQLKNVKAVTGADQATLARLYRASDVFVLPSVGDGFPLVLQEAAVCGLPLVCGADTAKADGRLAPMLYPIPIEGRDRADVTRLVLNSVRLALAEHEPAYAALRAALVSGWYNWEQSAKRYLEIFSDVLAGELGAPKTSGIFLSPAKITDEYRTPAARS